jgi:PQQ-dependent dehydrogenase (methanol/ethanol family)
MRFPMTQCVAAAALLMAMACGTRPSIETVDDARLIAADHDSANWLTYGRTYNEQRFSPLTHINESTVAGLGLVWSHELPTTRGVEATPIVVDGVIYSTSTWSIAYAFDAVTGRQLWTYDPKVDRTRARTICCDVVNRGLAVYRGKLYLATLDGRLVAIDARTGTPVWDVTTVDQSKPYAITGAPRIARGRVLIGNAGAEFGVRGYVSAFDAETGKLVWRAFAVPGDPKLGFESKALEDAAKTWHGEYWKTGGGGTTWDPIVYDPELDLVYFGTGNGTAWYRDLRSPGGGDNLFLASILAVRGTTGEYVWHYQVTPGDNWDFDATQPLVLAELSVGGSSRKVIMQASKNGFFYVLDRTNGKFISATQYVDGVSWATHIDSVTGRPVESPSAYAGMKPVLVSPDVEGGHNWQPMSFDAKKGILYLGVRNETQRVHAPNAEWISDISDRNMGDDPRYEGELNAKAAAMPRPRGELVAWSPAERRAVWRVALPTLQSGGVLATAGNLVFQGRADGNFIAYRATDGSPLWTFAAGTGIMAPPVTYLAGGKQYVTLMVGWGGTMGLANPQNFGPLKSGVGRILTFALDGKATLTPTPYGHSEPPVPAIKLDTTAAAVREGQLLYRTYCRFCHGLNAIAGPVPDLRYATAEVHSQFESIVLGGARKALGMPSFGDKLNASQVRAIQAYVLSRAAAAAPPR